MKIEQLERERKITEEALQPLQAQLADLNDQLSESQSKISALKARISKNDGRVDQILRVVVQL